MGKVIKDGRKTGFKNGGGITGQGKGGFFGRRAFRKEPKKIKCQKKDGPNIRVDKHKGRVRRAVAWKGKLISPTYEKPCAKKSRPTKGCVAMGAEGGGG